MIIKEKEFAVYHTSESDGSDICIKDPSNRFVLIYEDSIEDLIEVLVRFANKQWDNKSVSVRFEDL